MYPEYHKELDDSHSDYPRGTENIYIDDTTLSPYTKRLGETVKANSRKVNKFTPNLHDKTNYVLHLQQPPAISETRHETDKNPSGPWIHQVGMVETIRFIRY